MTEQELKFAIYEWLSSELGITVIYADQNAPRPDKPYATIRIISENKLGGNDEGATVDDDGIQSFCGQREAAVSLNIYGEDAFDSMKLALNSLSKPSILEDFFYNDDIAILNKGDILNLTDVLETEFEERAQMDLLVGYAEEYTDDVGYIETVELNEEVISI